MPALWSKLETNTPRVASVGDNEALPSSGTDFAADGLSCLPLLECSSCDSIEQTPTFVPNLNWSRFEQAEITETRKASHSL